MKSEKTILVVDDDITFSESIEVFLKHNSINCLTANTAQLALTIIKNRNVDAVSTDYDMPGMNGIDFARKLQSVEPSIPVIMMSGTLDNQEKSEISDIFFATLAKPVRLLDDYLPTCISAAELGSLQRDLRENNRLIHSLSDQTLVFCTSEENILCMENMFPSEIKEYSLNIDFIQLEHLEYRKEHDLIAIRWENSQAESILHKIDLLLDEKTFAKPLVVLCDDRHTLDEVSLFTSNRNVHLLVSDDNARNMLLAIAEIERTVQQRRHSTPESLNFLEFDSLNDDYLKDLNELSKLPNNSSFFRDQLGSFMDRSCKYLEMLRDSVTRESVADIGHCAHRLISICGFIGAIRSSKISQYIESSSLSGDLKAIKRGLKLLELELDSVKELLKNRGLA